jgi:LmbE family N-acetylglucosaminyl deacetylase
MSQTASALSDLCADAKDSKLARPVLAVAAHPDDEVLGLGGRLRILGERVHVVYVSDGAPLNPRFHRELGFADRNAYARARKIEARQALALAGIGESRIHELNAVDQAVVHDLERVTRELVAILCDVNPACVVSHPYEGGHPDHDATACAVHIAADRSRSRNFTGQLLEFASYHLREDGLHFGEFAALPTMPQRCVVLDAESQRLKQRMLECHRTQSAVWRLFPLDCERFREAPAYDFQASPPAPYYDHFDFGVTSSELSFCLREFTRSSNLNRPC